MNNKENRSVSPETAMEPDTTDNPADRKAPHLGQGGVDEKPVEAEGRDNPVHHSGRVPNSPLTK